MFRNVGNHALCDTASHTRKLTPSTTVCTSHCAVPRNEQQVYHRLPRQALRWIAQMFRQLKQTLLNPNIHNCDLFRVSRVNLRSGNTQLRCCLLHTRRQFPNNGPVMCSTLTVDFQQQPSYTLHICRQTAILQRRIWVSSRKVCFGWHLGLRGTM